MAVLLRTCFALYVVFHLVDIRVSGVTRGPLIEVSIDSEAYLYLVDKRFVSFTLDSYSFVEHLRNFNTSHVKYRNIARGLAPVFFRVGGTESDKLVFGIPDRGFSVITVQDFDTVCEFSKAVGWNMSFDLNLQYRNNSQWNASNALMLMDYATSKGYVLDLELGNEPDLYHTGQRIAPQQIGRDFIKLRDIMDSKPAYRGRQLMGPSLSSPIQTFLTEFLQTASTVVDVISVHHYYMGGHDLTPARMVDPRILDSITYTINKARSIITNSSRGSQVLWLAEAGLSWSASPPNTSGFIAGFMWMDTLGMSAANNVSLIARQTFGSLVGDNETPTPEYWIALLFKRLVGQRVLKVTSSEGHHYFRIYAHCSLQTPGGVTFYYMNLYPSDLSWTLPLYLDHSYELYSLTVGGNGTMSSSIVNLNGQPISMDGDNVPVLHPVTSQTWPLSVRSFSYGFLVLPNANAKACL